MNNKGFSLFLIIWAGDFISTIGSGLTAFSLGVYAFKMTGQATSSTMVILCTFLPAFLLRPIGGILADRLNRTSIMILGNLGSAFGASLILLMMTQFDNLLLIYPGIILSSIFFALQNPAYKACVSDYLAPEQYSKASGLLQLSNSAQFLIAPIMSGILMSVVGIHVILLIDILTFIFSALTVIFIKCFSKVNNKPVEKIKSQFFQDFIEGLRAITANRGIFFLVFLVSILLFYIGLIQSLLTPMVLSFSDVQALGYAQSICAIGMLVTSIMISVVERKRNNAFILAVSLALMGISFSFIGITDNIWAIIIPGFLFFSVIPFANSSIDVLIRKNISNEKQGRMWSFVAFFTYLGSMFAYSLSGFLADKIFNPLFTSEGKLASSLGYIFGVGPGRGIAFMFFLSGIFVVFISIFVYKSKLIWKLESQEYTESNFNELATKMLSN